jgi:hypothetical protein
MKDKINSFLIGLFSGFGACAAWLALILLIRRIVG